MDPRSRIDSFGTIDPSWLSHREDANRLFGTAPLVKLRCDVGWCQSGAHVVPNVACRACERCRCVFNMTWGETCKCLSQTSFRDFVVATVAMPGITASVTNERTPSLSEQEKNTNSTRSMYVQQSTQQEQCMN